MHISALALVAPAFFSCVSAWTLDLTASDGRTSRSSGHFATDREDLSWTPALTVNGANFNPETAVLIDPSTFELYVDKGCQGLSYRNGPGNYVLTPARAIRSYKVY
jgi:hypothetical protein